MNAARVALIGDLSKTVTAHRAIPIALRLAGERLDVPVEFEWIHTSRLPDPALLHDFGGFWCVPASPYANPDGAIDAIRLARVERRPFLGTCGGFQHAVVEYARNVLGWADAAHGEDHPDAGRRVIDRMACALVEVERPIRVLPGTRLAEITRQDTLQEGFHCSFGVNPEFRAALAGGPLRLAATDEDGDIRAVEIAAAAHPFYIATLFQPERAALAGRSHPIVEAFVSAAAAAQL